MTDLCILNGEQLPAITDDVIMVTIADFAWTQEALHRACAMARKTNATVALLKLVPVQHSAWLGTDLGYMNLSERDEAELDSYVATLEDYGVDLFLHVFQYTTLVEAIDQAADFVGAHIVFATAPGSWIPYWKEFQLFRIRRNLARGQRELVEQPASGRRMAGAAGKGIAKGNEDEFAPWHASVPTPGVRERM